MNIKAGENNSLLITVFNCLVYLARVFKPVCKIVSLNVIKTFYENTVLIIAFSR